MSIMKMTPITSESRVTDDDGTARDKVTRIQHLGQMSVPSSPGMTPRFEVIACIAGRDFGVRREDMKKMLLATRGRVFTLKTLARLVECSALRGSVTRHPATKDSLTGRVGPVTESLYPNTPNGAST